MRITEKMFYFVPWHKWFSTPYACFEFSHDKYDKCFYFEINAHVFKTFLSISWSIEYGVKKNKKSIDRWSK